MDIISPEGQKVGEVRFTFIHSMKELESRFRNYLPRIPFPITFPFGVFESMEVEERHRGNGYSHIGTKMVDGEFQKVGVNGAFLVIGATNPISQSLEEKLEDFDWKAKKIYEPAGWVRLPSKKWWENWVMVKQY